MELSAKRIDFNPSNSGLMVVTAVHFKNRVVMNQGKSFKTKGIQHQIELADVITLEVLVLLLVQNVTVSVILLVKIVPVF